MKISQRTDYACRALLHLAQAYDGRSVLRADDIAQAEAIPTSFLAQILHSLKKHGFVTSRRGKSGGWILARPPSQIDLLEIITALEPQLLEENGPEQESPAATAIQGYWQELREVLRGKLAQTTLESLGGQLSSPMYFI
ncbi:MAG: RrF2 family transcriptional regulator [Verrucomicrobiales bacterium]